MKTERWGRGKGLWGKEEDDIRDLGERERETGGRLQSCELKIQRRTGGVEKGGGGRSAEEGWI